MPQTGLSLCLVKTSWWEWDTEPHSKMFKGKDWRDDSVTKSTFVASAEDPDSQHP